MIGNATDLTWFCEACPSSIRDIKQITEHPEKFETLNKWVYESNTYTFHKIEAGQSTKSFKVEDLEWQDLVDD